jgi:hypothetical protein
MKGKASTAYEAAAIVDGGNIRYDASFDVLRPRVGYPLELVVRLTSAGKPIHRRARVTVTFIRPTTEISLALAEIKPSELRAFEPGLSLNEQKHLVLVQKSARWISLKPRQEQLVMQPNQKGEFRTRIRPRVPGIYTAVVTIEGEIEKVGRFSRTVTAVTVVRSQNRER